MLSRAGLAGGIETTGLQIDKDACRNIYKFAMNSKNGTQGVELEMNMSLDTRPHHPFDVRANAEKTIVCFTESPSRNTYNIVLIEHRKDGSVVVLPHFGKQVVELLNENHVAFRNTKDSFYLKAVEDSKRGTVLDIRSPKKEFWFEALDVKLLVQRDGKITIAGIERPN